MSKPTLKEVCEALDGALKRLHDATSEYESAARQESAARSATTAALNKLNGIQKEMDRLDADLKAAMPRDSDWQRRQNRINEIPVNDIK